MPRRCVAAGCDTTSGMGYSLHSFPKDETVRKRWISAVKRQRSNWNGPSSCSLLCSKHFKEDCFVTEGVRYREDFGVPALKRLKADAVPTIFPRSSDRLDDGSSSSTPSDRPLSERRQQRSVRLYNTYIYVCMYAYVCSYSYTCIYSYRVFVQN